MSGVVSGAEYLASEQTALRAELLEAYGRRDYDAMHAALAEGANPNTLINDITGRSILYEAAFLGDTQAMDVLLAWGADPDMRELEGRATPVISAVRGGKLEACELLLEAGADPLQPDARNHNAVFYIYADANNKIPANERELFADLIEDYSQRRPSINPGKDIETLKDRLFEYDKRGYTPLDNPKVWKKFDQISESLFEAGTPVTLDDWLDINARGERWIDVAVRFRQLDKVVEHLHAQGEVLPNDMVVHPEGGLTEFGEQVVAKGQIKHLFTHSQFKEDGLAGVRRFKDALPESAMHQVNNLHGLIWSLTRNNSDRSMER